MFESGEILEGHNYGFIASLAKKLGYHGEKVHGFITSSGEFVLPDEAVDIALNSKQITEIVDTLTPEMLWKDTGIEL